MLRNTKSKNIEIYFDGLRRLAGELVPEEKIEKGLLSKWSNKNYEQEKIGQYIVSILQSFQLRQSFPALTFQEENELLKKLANLSKQLIIVAVRKLQHDVVDKSFMDIFSMIHTVIKSLMQEFFPLKATSDMNFHYLERYAACREVGMPCPPRYALLKQEVLDVFHCYYQPHSLAKFNALLRTAIETLENDELGINSHSGNSSQSFLNIVKWLNLFRLMLISQSEPILLPSITRAMDRALGIVRPDAHRTLETQRSLLKKYDLIQIEIDALDKKKLSIDSNYCSSLIKVGIFSRPKTKCTNPNTIENDPVLGITKLI